MAGTGYKILGYAVWRGAKWYVRRRLPSARLSVATITAVVGAVLIARRVAGGRSDEAI